MAEEEKEEKNDADSPSEGKKGGSFVMILVAAGLAAVMSMGGTMIVASRLLAKVASASQSDSKHKNEKDSKKEDLFDFPLGEFTVNLADPERYARASLSVAVKGDLSAIPEGEGEGGGGGGHGEGGEDASSLPPIPEVIEMQEKTAVLRHTVIQVFGAQSYQDLLTPAGKEALCNQLLKALNKHLEEAEVKEIYFTQLVMQ